MATDLSKRSIEAAKPQEKPYELRDNMVRGLILRVQPSGLKAWVVERARGQRRTLSQAYPVTTLDAARAQAMAMLSGAEPWDRPKAEKVVTMRGFLRDSYRPWVEAERKSGKATVNRIESAFAEFLDKPITSLSTFALDKWKRDRLNDEIEPATVNRDLNALRSALGKAVEWHALEVSPLAGVKDADVEKDDRVRYLSADEEKRLRKALLNRDKTKIAARDRTIAGGRTQHAKVRALPENGYADYLTPLTLVAINTGCRRGELTGLTWDKVDFSNALMTVTAATSKASKTRHIPLNKEALTVLKQWQKQNRRGRVFPIQSQKKAWASLMTAAKIQDFRLHDCRHHFASRLVMAGVDLNTVRELLGHSDIKMTLRYAHLAPEHKAAAVEKLGAKR
jgi:integrase